MLPTRVLALFLSAGIAIAATAPALTYSTYLRDAFTPNAVAVDASGNVYIAGAAVIDPALPYSKVAMVEKLNPQTGQYLYRSILNGEPNQVVNAIAVDPAGNAYVAGATPNGQTEQAFVAKLDPNGDLVSFTNIGGLGQAIAVTASGQILVSGMSSVSGFTSTSGAYSAPDAGNPPFLMELDATLTKTIFAATGIGGSAIALDPAGNIYVAGSTVALDYPTTPGAYQTKFPAFFLCYSVCMFEFQGPNQYVTKVDPTGAHLLYSTALTGTGGTQNLGLAVDAAGEAYVTGYAGAGYPYSVTPPSPGPLTPTLGASSLPFVSKLDAAGANLLFSVPVGGSGIQVDPSGNVDVSGGYGSAPIPNYTMTANLPALANVPPACLPNQLLSTNTAYAAQIDGAQGTLLSTQFIGGDSLKLSAATISGSVLWVAGASNDASVPFTPNGLTLYFPGTASPAGAGAYLGAVDFSQPQPPAGTPQIYCVLDAADNAGVGPVSPLQLLTIFGTDLGPATGVAASDYSDTNVGGVQVSIGGIPAQLLYAASNQINLAVPVPVPQTPIGNLSALQVSFNGATSSSRALPISDSFVDPQIFANGALTFPLANPPTFFALALNPDGSVNSPSKPAQLGSTISVFVNGLVPNPNVLYAPLILTATGGWVVQSFNQAGPFVTQVKVQAPATLNGSPGGPDFGCPPNQSPVCSVGLTLYESGGPAYTPIGPSPGTQAMVYLTR